MVTTPMCVNCKKICAYWLLMMIMLLFTRSVINSQREHEPRAPIDECDLQIIREKKQIKSKLIPAAKQWKTPRRKKKIKAKMIDEETLFSQAVN